MEQALTVEYSIADKGRHHVQLRFFLPAPSTLLRNSFLFDVEVLLYLSTWNNKNVKREIPARHIRFSLLIIALLIFEKGEFVS